jgi:protein TonB
MFGTLIESMATPQRRTGGSAASLLAHAALIGGAVFATAGNRQAPPAPPVDERPVVFRLPVAQPPEARRPRAVTHAATSAAPSLPALEVPAIIPSTIPPIDFSIPATPTDFSDRRSHEAADGCSGICGRHGAESETPTWIGNDAIMQLREQVVAPRYPERLRQAGVEGKVVVKFVVDTLAVSIQPPLRSWNRPMTCSPPRCEKHSPGCDSTRPRPDRAKSAQRR